MICCLSQFKQDTGKPFRKLIYNVPTIDRLPNQDSNPGPSTVSKYYNHSITEADSP